MEKMETRRGIAKETLREIEELKFKVHTLEEKVEFITNFLLKQEGNLEQYMLDKYYNNPTNGGHCEQ